MTKEWITIVWITGNRQQYEKLHLFTPLCNGLLHVTSEYCTIDMALKSILQHLLFRFSPFYLYLSSCLTPPLPPRPWTGLSWALSRTVTPLFHRSIILFAPLQIWVFICPSICLLPLAWQVEMTRRDSKERRKNRSDQRGEGRERQGRYLREWLKGI